MRKGLTNAQTTANVYYVDTKKQEASCPNTQEVGWLLEAYLPSAYCETLDGGLCHQIVYTSMSCSPAYKLCTSYEPPVKWCPDSLVHMKAVLWTAIGEGELCIHTLSVSACYTA